MEVEKNCSANMDTPLNGNLNKHPKSCNSPKDNLYPPSYYNPTISMTNSSSYRIIYLPKAGKVDVKAKEAILITSALLLLGFSLFQFYKKWVKHYRDINQGSFTSYYYKYNAESLPVMESPKINRKDSARMNWKKLGAAVSINARMRAIRTRKQLEDARINDPLIYDNLNLSNRNSSSSFRRKSTPVPRPQKWALVRSVVVSDDEKGANKSRRFQQIPGTEPKYTSNKSITSGRGRTASRVRTALNRRALITTRDRIKSRSLDDTTVSKPFTNYYQPQDKVYEDENDVFTAPSLRKQSKENTKRSSVVISSKSPSIYNCSSSEISFVVQANGSDKIVIEDRRKSEPLSNILSPASKTEGHTEDKKCKIHYVQETRPEMSSTEGTSNLESNGETLKKDIDTNMLLKPVKATDTWVKLPNTNDASELV